MMQSDATGFKHLAPHELKAKFLAEKLLKKNSLLSSSTATISGASTANIAKNVRTTNSNPPLNLSAFETFKPSKSRILDTVPIVTDNNSNGDIRSYNRRKNLFSALESVKGGLCIDQLSSTRAKQSTDSSTNNILISKKNLPTVTRYHLGSGHFGSTLIVELDIEANYDLRQLITCNNILNYNSTNGSDSLQQKLREWNEIQRNWIYPEVPVTAASFNSSLSNMSNELSLNEYWREPLPQDISAVGVIKRRRLKWQAALCSALNQLLNSRPLPHGKNQRPISDPSEETHSFYVLGPDAENTNNSDISAKGFGISAMFFRQKKLGNFSVIEEEGKGIEVSCILIGVKQLFIDRLIDLGAIPMAMVDDREAKNIEAKTRKRANPHAGSLGLLEDVSAGRTIHLTGAYSLRVAADLLTEIVFSTSKAKFTLDIPKIMSYWPFTNGVCTSLHASLVQCRHDFSEKSLSLRNALVSSESRIQKNQSKNNLSDRNTSNSSNDESGSDRTNITKTKIDSEGYLRNQYVAKPFHRVHLTGIMNSAALSKLAEVLHELSKPYSSPSLTGDNDILTAPSSSSDNNGGDNNSNDNYDSGSIDNENGDYVTNDDNGNLNNGDRIPLYRSVTINNDNGDDITNSNRKLPDEKFYSRLDSTFLRPNYTSSSPSRKKLSDPLSSPMKFVVANQPQAKVPMQFIQRSNPSNDLNWMDRNDKNGVNFNVLENDLRIKSQRRDEGNDIPSGLSWIAKRRICSEPYFIVSTTAPPKLERFNHRIQDNHVDNGNDIDKNDVNNVIIMGSQLPIHEIRWFGSPSTSSSSDRQKKYRTDDGATDYKYDEEEGNTENNTMTEEIGTNFDFNTEEMLLDKDNEHLHHITGAKRKFDTNNFNENVIYEAISGVGKLPLRLITIPHSKIVIEKNENTDGAVLKPLNEYEIFAPETLEDRERKKLSVRLFN